MLIVVWLITILPSASILFWPTPPHPWLCLHPGTSVIQLTATDADDPTYGNSARVVYSILEGQPYFSVDAKSGMTALSETVLLSIIHIELDGFQTPSS